MNKNIFKNINAEEVLLLSDQVQLMQGQIVSKTLVQNSSVSVTLFAFDKGEEISTHDSNGDALVTVLDGVGRFTIDGKEYLVKQGETLIMPAKKPHSVYAHESFKMLLIVVFPQ